MGIVVGVIEPSGRRIAPHGNLAKGDKRALGGDTVQNGASQAAKRVEGKPPPPPPAPKEVAIDPKVLDRYVGRYQLAPAFVLTVTREGDGLFVQATGQPRAQVFAMSEREFFYKIVEARITFVTDGTGRATSLVLHQNGAEIPGKRVE